MRDQREDALTAAKALGRMAEQFIGPAPRDGQPRRAERDRAIDVMRDGEKMLIEMVEASRRDDAELRQLRARLNSASPQAETMPTTQVGDVVVWRSGNSATVDAEFAGILGRQRDTDIIAIYRDPLWRRPASPQAKED